MTSGKPLRVSPNGGLPVEIFEDHEVVMRVYDWSAPTHGRKARGREKARRWACAINAHEDLLAAVRVIGSYEIVECPDCRGSKKLDDGGACYRCRGRGEMLVANVLPEDVRAARRAVLAAEGGR